MMRLVFVVALAAMFPSYASGQGSALASDSMVDVRQRDRASALGRTVLFGDVADVVTDDPGVASLLGRLEVSSLSGVVDDTTVARTRLLDAAAKAGVDLGRARWSGPELTRINVAPIVLAGSDAAALARRKLEAALGADLAKATIAASDAPADLRVCPGRRKTGFAAKLPSKRLVGEVRIEVLALIDDVETVSVTVVFDVRRRGAVLVASRELGAGTVVKDGDLAVEERELSLVPSESFDRPENAAGLVIARRVPAGHAVTSFDVRRRPVVLRGQEVRLRINQGGLTVVATGRALKDGAPGERVEVIHSGSRRPVEGRVVEAGLVELGNTNEEPRR